MTEAHTAFNSLPPTSSTAALERIAYLVLSARQVAVWPSGEGGSMVWLQVTQYDGAPICWRLEREQAIGVLEAWTRLQGTI